MNLKNGKVFTSKFFAIGPSSYEKKNIPGRGLTEVQKHWSGRPPVLGAALFFLSSSAFLDEHIDHESRSKATSSANHLERVCNHTSHIRFRLLSYFTHNWNLDCFICIYIVYPLLNEQFGHPAYASVDSTVLWQK